MTQPAAFATDTIADPYSGGEPPHTANRILNYRRLQNWENYFLASAICSVAVAVGADEEQLKTIGNEKVNNGFHYFSAITGDMFCVLYSAEKPCDSGLTNYFFVPQVIKKAFAAFGHACIYLSNAQIKKDFRTVMNAIKASIDQGIPVLSWGMGNVTTMSGWHGDMPEGCLIGGYDGDLLYANLYLGPEVMEVDSDGYSGVPGGLEGVKGLFFVGGPIEKPEPKAVYHQAIMGIPALLSMLPAEGYDFGQAACEKWADTLLDESRYAGKTDAELSAICWKVHLSPYCNICTSAGLTYLRAAAEGYDIDIAKKLLPLYAQFTRLRQEIWELHGLYDKSDFFPPMDKFKTKEYRTNVAEILRRMGSICAEIINIFPSTGRQPS
jgi:hypothetical protein